MAHSTLHCKDIIRVPSPGTPVQFVTAPQDCLEFMVQAHIDNQGNIYIGDSTVSSTRGFCLTPGNTYWGSNTSYSKVCSDGFWLQEFYVDAEFPNDGIVLHYYKLS